MRQKFSSRAINSPAPAGRLAPPDPRATVVTMNPKHFLVAKAFADDIQQKP
jgi:hypothetical protein